MSKSFTYGGEDLSIYGLQVVDYSIPFMANTIAGSHNAMFGDSIFTSINHTTRDIVLNCAVRATTKAALQTNMDSITGILNPMLADQVILFDDFPDRRFIGRVVSVSAPEVKGRWGFAFTVTVSTMAHLQSLGETNASQPIASSPDTLTIANVTGNVSRIPVEIYIRNTTGGDLASTAITVANDTTGDTITWKGTLQDDRWLRFGSIDTKGRFAATIEKSDGTGADPEAEAYTSVESGYQSGDWVRLKGGVDNDITITGVSAGTIEYTYRGRYL